MAYYSQSSFWIGTFCLKFECDYIRVGVHITFISKLTKADVAKQAIQQAQFEATNRSDSFSYEQHAESTSKYNESKIFIQRRLLHTLYNPNIPVYICPLCGQQFHSSVGHKGHLTSKVCQRKKIKEEDEQDHQVVKGGTPTKKNERDVAVSLLILPSTGG